MTQQRDAQVVAEQDGAAIRDTEFEAVRRFLYDQTGISLGGNKREMVCARLAKRLRHHGMQSFGDYLSLVRDGDASGAELQEFINCLTTNKTDFFREPHHFKFLRETLIPRVRAKSRRLRIWSAGCSTGEEPYSLAMTLREHCPAAEGWDARILASDIDTSVLATAEKGVYDFDRIGDIPDSLRRKYFLRGKDANAGKVATKPELRDLIAFRRINLMDPQWPVRSRFDAIFCRNVVIYFDRDTQRRLFERFTAILNPDGLLFLGHSENLHWMADRFVPVGNTIYRLQDSAGSRVSKPVLESTPPPSPRKMIPPPAETPPEHSIILGDVKTARGPAILKTLLGSCVSACIFDPETRVGGMNHFSLPGVSDEGVSARYGAHAMEMLITAVMKQGGERHRLRAKVFGGAKVLDVQSELLNVGARNAEFVIKFLAAEGIPIEGQCLGGTRGLIVRFRADTGQAQAKPLTDRDLKGVVHEEEQFGRELVAKTVAPPDDGITLF